MDEIADRYRHVAAGFTARVEGVAPPEAWSNPAPCEGWVARDVVRHVVEWMPSLLFGADAPAMPSVDEDPVAAWRALDDLLQRSLDDPAVAGRELDIRPGRFRFEDAVANFCIGDLLMHTWDLARATGQDEALDPDEVHGLLVGMEPIDEMLRSSGHYGPRVPVPDDADEQTRLIAFTGRQP